MSRFDPDRHTPRIPEPGTAEAIRASEVRDDSWEHDPFFDPPTISAEGTLRALRDHDGDYAALRDVLVAKCIDAGIDADYIREVLHGG